MTEKSFSEFLKDALAKKKAAQHPAEHKDTITANTGKKTPTTGVVGKPIKKSTGRGR
jgi:hypothetical protein